MNRIIALFALLAGVGCGDVVERTDDQPDPPDAQTQVSSPDAMTLFSDAASQPSPDASLPPDATVQTSLTFDVAYVNHIKVENTTAVSGGSFGVVVNTGADPVDLSTATVTAMTDNHPIATYELYVYQTNLALDTGEAGGNLSPLATTYIVDSGIVNEPVVTQQFMLGYKLLNLPAGAYTVKTKAVLEISGTSVSIPMTFDVDTNGSGFGVSFLGADRVSSN